ILSTYNQTQKQFNFQLDSALWTNGGTPAGTDTIDWTPATDLTVNSGAVDMALSLGDTPEEIAAAKEAIAAKLAAEAEDGSYTIADGTTITLSLETNATEVELKAAFNDEAGNPQTVVLSSVTPGTTTNTMDFDIDGTTVLTTTFTHGTPASITWPGVDPTITLANVIDDDPTHTAADEITAAFAWTATADDLTKFKADIAKKVEAYLDGYTATGAITVQLQFVHDNGAMKILAQINDGGVKANAMEADGTTPKTNPIEVASGALDAATSPAAPVALTFKDADGTTDVTAATVTFTVGANVGTDADWVGADVANWESTAKDLGADMAYNAAAKTPDLNSTAWFTPAVELANNVSFITGAAATTFLNTNLANYYLVMDMPEGAVVTPGVSGLNGKTTAKVGGSNWGNGIGYNAANWPVAALASFGDNTYLNNYTELENGVTTLGSWWYEKNFSYAENGTKPGAGINTDILY
ncbi:hypothetical protein D7X94_17900, partial [Acutalibacter sp. 1XD8-33]|uniref:hypothetical protein n=1 Tax=Acutalibacter sp. 1XD8-33 TaxID=2320081 RepID=UPI000EEFC0B1